MSIQVDTKAFETVHRKKPRGRDQYRFLFQFGTEEPTKLKAPLNMSFVEARAWAKRQMSTYQDGVLTVVP